MHVHHLVNILTLFWYSHIMDIIDHYEAIKRNVLITCNIDESQKHVQSQRHQTQNSM